jgi:hypothetical protein
MAASSTAQASSITATRNRECDRPLHGYSRLVDLERLA